jgi:AraC family transcriptional regulator
MVFCLGPDMTKYIATIENSLSHHPDRPRATSRERHWPGVTVDVHDGSADYYMDAPALDHHVVVHVPFGSGRIRQERAGQKFEAVVCAGSVIIHPAGHPCRWSGSSPPSIRMRVPLALIANAIEESGMRQAPQGEIMNVFHTRDQLIQRVSDTFTTELDLPPHPVQGLVIESTSYLLAAHLLRRYDAFSSQRREISSGLRPRILRRVIEYLEHNFTGTISLEDMAKQAGVSKFHFVRIFKASTGLTPMAYLERMRLRESEALLRRSELSLSQVARASGFTSRRYFSRRFTRVLGHSPSEYARYLRQER